MQNYTFFYKPQLFLRIFFHFSMSGCKKIATGKQFFRPSGTVNPLLARSFAAAGSLLLPSFFLL